MGRSTAVKIALVGLMLLALLACSTWSHNVAPESLLPQSKVIKRDSQNRIQVMGTRAGNGSCLAEITYDGVPRIHIVVISRTRIENLGFLQINDAKKGVLSEEVMLKLFTRAIKDYCLPLIVQGYADI